MSNSVIVIGCLLMGLLVALICLRQSLKKFSVRRLIVTTPTTPINQLSSGLREVKGRLVLNDAGKVAPFSEKRVAYYDFSIAEPTNDEDSNGYETVVEDEYFAQVSLDDGTGTLKLEWDRAELKLLAGHTMQAGLFRKKVSDDLKARLQRLYNYDTKGLLMDKAAQYKEKTLEPGCELYAIGRVSMEQDGFVMNAAGPTFIVGDMDESSLAFGYTKAGVAWALGALLGLAAGGGVAWLLLQLATR